jgi:hypothetical protein
MYQGKKLIFFSAGALHWDNTLWGIPEIFKFIIIIIIIIIIILLIFYN